MIGLLDLLAFVLATGAASPLDRPAHETITVPRGAAVIARDAEADGLDARFAPQPAVARATGRGGERPALSPAVILVPAGWAAARATVCGRV